jgi:hypothetical protein
MGEQFLDSDFQDIKIAKFETLAQMVCCPLPSAALLLFAILGKV